MLKFYLREDLVLIVILLIILFDTNINHVILEYLKNYKNTKPEFH